MIKEVKERTGCKVKKEGKLYRVYEAELDIIQLFIYHIEDQGYRVFIHEGPEKMGDTNFYGILAEIVYRNDLPEEEQWGYTVICDYDCD